MDLAFDAVGQHVSDGIAVANDTAALDGLVMQQLQVADPAEIARFGEIALPAWREGTPALCR